MINAIKNKIFLKKDQYPDKIGLLYVPKLEGQYAPPYVGTIVACGPSVSDSDYVIGAKVLFHDLCGIQFDYGNETFFSINDSDVIAVIFDKNLKIY